MDPLWIVFAFAFGFAVKQIKLPPLVGFLAAGFALNYFGIKGGEVLYQIADLGILLLLFSIGLKLKVKDLLKPQIWAVTSIHMAITVLFFGTLIFVLSAISFSIFTNVTFTNSIIIAFALSFSSTIFAVKILEETGAMSSSHGKIAIGILVVQDIFAVIFITFTSSKTPSPWAFLLLLLLFVPFILKKTKFGEVINKSGHGELMILLGILIPLVGASLFSHLGLKEDLGALVFGVLLANHPRSKELANSMLSLKDLFLVGFFLTIGLSGSPTIEHLGISFLLALIIPVKLFLFFFLLTRFKLRSRTSFLTTLSLSNYSEFGLIVGTAAAAKGWISSDWLVIFALAISFTFILASPLNVIAQKLFTRFQKELLLFESERRLSEDKPMEFTEEQVIVFGMGRTGLEVYNVMEKTYQLKVLGVDISSERIETLKTLNKNVIQGDATDLNFWQRINLSENLPVVILATSCHANHMQVINRLKEIHCSIQLAAISRFDDEMEELEEAGVQVVFNLYTEAGAGFAHHTFNALQNEKIKNLTLRQNGNLQT